MYVEQAQCQIYPTKEQQMCVRLKIVVNQLEPDNEREGQWVAKDEPLCKEDVICGQQGLERVLALVGRATKPPTPRPRKAAGDA